MARPKRTLFTVLGWIVWKLLALFGVKAAKDKLAGGPGRDAGRGRR